MSQTSTAGSVELIDLEPPADDVRAQVVTGLIQTRKALPCKLFYDARGSRLFDRICTLPEYYPTRTEVSIMTGDIRDIAQAVGGRALLVEYGSGSSTKTRLLLDHLAQPAGYVPIDISREHLLRAAIQLAQAYPRLPIRAVCADYTTPLALPEFDPSAVERVVAYFPGSTIGNFEPDEAVAFLQTVRQTCGPDSALLIGVDLKKDPALLHAAYNDSAGLTAAFNLNILQRINRDLGADFDPDAFAHYAFYNVPAGRMEMHLVSRREQEVNLGADVLVPFAEGESIHTENCYKYTLDGFMELADRAGYTPTDLWLDEDRLFSVMLLRTA